MGKGDQRSKRGKIWRGTHGKRRPRKRKKRARTAAAPGPEATSPPKRRERAGAPAS